ncbi:MAG: hypothetical protein IKX59_03575 [Bacteroidales bacterium]|nr:hypothetical protein [Bacteroidales bacterium]
MDSKPTIGSLINDEVRRQQIPITEFAKMINCRRNNVYNIFERNNIDIQLLKRISEKLKHNYFEDLAKDIDLARPVPIDEKELERLRAINQFLEYVPKAFEKLSIDVAIVSGTKQGKEKEIPLPDFILSKLNITFTIGQTYEDKCNGFWGNNIIFQKCNTNADLVCYWKKTDGIQFLDIAIVNKTEEEWFATIQKALEEIEILYLPRTWYYLKSLNEEYNGGN